MKKYKIRTDKSEKCILYMLAQAEVQTEYNIDNTLVIHPYDFEIWHNNLIKEEILSKINIFYDEETVKQIILNNDTQTAIDNITNFVHNHKDSEKAYIIARKQQYGQQIENNIKNIEKQLYSTINIIKKINCGYEYLDKIKSIIDNEIK